MLQKLKELFKIGEPKEKEATSKEKEYPKGDIERELKQIRIRLGEKCYL